MDGTKIVSGGAAGAGIGPVAVYAANRLGAHLNSEDGALIGVAAVAVVAFIAHNGVRGVGRLVWRGASPADAA